MYWLPKLSFNLIELVAQIVSNSMTIYHHVQKNPIWVKSFQQQIGCRQSSVVLYLCIIQQKTFSEKNHLLSALLGSMIGLSDCVDWVSNITQSVCASFSTVLLILAFEEQDGWTCSCAAIFLCAMLLILWLLCAFQSWEPIHIWSVH